jgi:uncharacterized protein YecT (DUF1311 family)
MAHGIRQFGLPMAGRGSKSDRGGKLKIVIMGKHIILIMLLVFAGTVAFGQSQSEMDSNAATSAKKAENELNATYRKILRDYGEDTVFIRKLKFSQRLWIKFREAEIDMKYPPREPGYYGSVLPMCVAMYKEGLTRDRIKILKVWLDGIEEGDVCNGSVKVKGH